jgi:2,3-bisphosphoglycerate-dependent phosphoglycerate mutase
MLRAVETVAPVAAALDLPVEGRLDLHEVGGVFEGEFLESAARGHPGAPAGQLLAVCPQLHLPEGVDETGWYRLRPEPIDEGRIRAERVVAGLREDYGPTDEVLAVVAHGWFFQYILGAFLGLGLGPDGHLPQWFTFKNTATAYLVEPDTDHFHNRRIVWLNRTDHLTQRQGTE